MDADNIRDPLDGQALGQRFVQQFGCLGEPCRCAAFLTCKSVQGRFADDFQCKSLGCERRETISIAGLPEKSRRQAPDSTVAKFRRVAYPMREMQISPVFDYFKSEYAAAGVKKVVCVHFSSRMEHRRGRSAFTNAAAVNFSVTAVEQDREVRMRVQVLPDSGPGLVNRLGKAQISHPPLV
jgi:hypothetical protein